MGDIPKGKIDKISGRQEKLCQLGNLNASQREMSKTWGGSTQEPTRNDRRSVVFGPQPEICQSREWHLHRSQDLLQKRTWNTPQLDFTYTIVVLESRDDVMHAA